ncbi:MAG: hypothetical protein KatS3mg022_0588 [Armatimonadota bacterium]|nr:MAG: hypothetical protein KatS3mg022_0588 [Armatimonadota bacterium]
MTQHIRRSQFIYTYGPGAIIEGINGPRLIPRPDKGLFHDYNLKPEDFEISDQRVSQGLLRGARVFRLPSNAELGRFEKEAIYKTKMFPSWRLCPQVHKGGFSALYQGSKCPVCNAKGGHHEAIRFVLACPEGHLDDVDWYDVVHSGKKCSGRPRYYKWFQTGSSLSQVQIQCPGCSKKVNLGWAYKQPWKCSGRFPERKDFGVDPVGGRCTKHAFMIQRQAANLRIPELFTLFTIPPRATRLHHLLESQSIRTVWAMHDYNFADKADFMNELDKLVRHNLLESSVYEEINNYGWEDIQQALQHLSQSPSSNYSDLISEEFAELLKASIRGYPPSRDQSGAVLFEVDPGKVGRVPGPHGKLRFRVAPLLRLRTVTVQKGYRREVGGAGDPPAVVDVSFTDRNNVRWYPGTEFLGEGVFVSLEDGSIDCQKKAVAQKWMDAYQKENKYPEHLFRDGSKRDELHPVFVWWHTLSHFLIRAISVDSGYSSAAIRERVYVSVDKSVGGIVLYATQPGSEGSSGGLISLVPHFGSILQRALEMAENCSNDPLCLENHFQSGKYGGAACYGCALISETSCEHRNLWLDREVLLENAP